MTALKLEINDASGTCCYHFDATGNTVAMTNSSQNIANAYTNDPFGNILDQQETDPQPFKYVGQYGVMAEANGFCYMRARYYDPQVGRFVSEDPQGFDGGDVNLYLYAHGNPVMLSDPSGLMPPVDPNNPFSQFNPNNLKDNKAAIEAFESTLRKNAMIDNLITWVEDKIVTGEAGSIISKLAGGIPTSVFGILTAPDIANPYDENKMVQSYNMKAGGSCSK